MTSKFFSVSRNFFYLFFIALPFQLKVLVSTREIYSSGFFNPFLSHNFYLSDFFLILGLIFLGLSIFTKSRSEFKLRADRIFWSVLLMFFAYLVSLLFAVNLVNSLFYVLRFLEFFVVYLLVANGFVDLKKLLYLLFGVISFVAFLGILQHFMGNSLGFWFLGEPVVSSAAVGVAKVVVGNQSLLRIYGTFPHPNVFAFYLVFALFVGFYFLKSVRKSEKRKRFWICLLLFLCLFALFLTFSRSAWLGAVIGLFFVLSKVHGKKLLKLKFVFALVGVFFLFLFLLNLDDVLLQRLLGGDGAMSERNIYFDVGKNMFFKNWLGVGAGNFTAYMQTYTDVRLMPWFYQPVHNIFLLTLAELGLLGFLVLIHFFGSLYSVLARFWNKKKHLVFLGGIWFSMLIVGLFDHYLLSLYQGQMILATFAGIVTSASVYSRL